MVKKKKNLKMKAKIMKKKSTTPFICPTCKYEAHKLAGYSHCPLCLICDRCKKRVRHCNCKEGE
ncbi:hypothetical protein HYX13_02815 [Candidatus Woesearchaeota archaeon]|nr:hypothetical protein [Candidatus Woesearchaeota archaeon]